MNLQDTLHFAWTHKDEIISEIVLKDSYIQESMSELEEPLARNKIGFKEDGNGDVMLTGSWFEDYFGCSIIVDGTNQDYQTGANTFEIEIDNVKLTITCYDF